MNLNEVWYYDDPTDRWAAEREYELRIRRWKIAREGVAGIVARASAAFVEFGRAIAGEDRMPR